MELLQTVHIIEVLESFLEKRRPPEELRKIRPSYFDLEKMTEYEIAKATYVKSKDLWKVFWKRANMKWLSYAPCPTVKKIEEFVNLVGEDKINCFWG